MKTLLSVPTLLAASLAALTLAGCGDDDTSIEDAAENVEDQAEDAADDLEDAADDAADELDNG